MIVLGLDGGIASIGWALIDEAEQRIIACGARCFDAPETDKDRVPTNQIRRQKRGMRRLIKRRRHRMRDIRQLFAAHGLLEHGDKDALTLGIDPWAVRSDGLERVLTPAELAAALGHIAAHRGFRSNAKRDRAANAADDASKMLKAIDDTRGKLTRYRTVGQMFAKDPDFALRKRNRGGDYSRTVKRDDLGHEVAVLFETQRRLGNLVASEALQEDFARIAFFQNPLKNSDDLVGNCLFEPTERRTARRSPSFELFRLLSRLNALELVTPHGKHRFKPDELQTIVADFGTTKGVTFTAVRRLLKLDAATRFAGVGPDDEKNDVAARSGKAFEGSANLRDALGEALWAACLAAPEILDRIAEILTFRDDEDEIRAGLAEIACEAAVIDAVMKGLAAGAFTSFKGTARISAKAARAIVPGLLRGLVYSEACADAGYDHAAARVVGIGDVRNPVARKALAEMMRQVRTIVAKYGRLPDRIHVELARDVGKSAEERDEISRGIEKRNKQRDKARERFREKLRQEPSAEELLRFELWEEQNGRCLYTDDCIPVTELVSSSNVVQVDHILPWSRFGDDSYLNKTLCFASANQRKLDRTPFEWFSAEKTANDWVRFERAVEGCKAIRGAKKRGFYLRQNGAEVAERFRNRNLGDTRYATRVLMGLLARLYPKEGERHVLARPGALTSKLRRGWGLQGLKKDEDGKRLPDDRHHALDAIVLAVTTESMVQGLTRAFQEAERRGLARDFAGEAMVDPWPGFRVQAEEAVARVAVSRPERRQVPGEAHAATIKQVRVVDGAQVVFIRKAVEALTEKDLERVPVPAPYGRIADPAKLRAAMIEAIRAWWANGKPKDAMPQMPNGDVIRKVRVQSTDKVAVSVRGGTADRGDMARVDVFREIDRKGKVRFHLVPIYPHQLATLKEPPNLAIVQSKNEDEWTNVRGPEFDFLFSLYQNSLIEIQKSKGPMVRGYFKGAHRGTAALSLATMVSPTDLTDGIGSKTLLDLRKLKIDRLGIISVAPEEPRTWRGAVCT